MELPDNDPRAVAVKCPCAICSAPATGRVWDTDLCHEHYGVWFADPRFESGNVDAAIGMTKIRLPSGTEMYPVHTPAQREAANAEYRKRMASWLAEMRKTARAA